LPTLAEPPRFRLPAGGAFTTLEMADGLALRAWARPLPEAWGRILLLNGRADFLEKWAGVAEELGGLGLSVAAFDWRGQGASGREVTSGAGHIDSFETWLDDLDRVHGWACAALPGPGPMLALGHSMGGHLLLRWLARRPDRPIGRLVLTAPFCGFAMPGPAAAALGLVARAQRTRGHGPDWAPGQGPYGPERMSAARMAILSSDLERFRDEARWVAANPVLAVGGVTWGWLAAAHDSLQALARADLSRLPSALMLLAERERLVSNPRALAVARRMPDCAVATIAGAGHEILREADGPRRDALSRIRGFLAMAGA
jgi:lysophospholipase